MLHTSRQLKALARNLSKGDSVQTQIILRNYIMGRFWNAVSPGIPVSWIRQRKMRREIVCGSRLWYPQPVKEIYGNGSQASYGWVLFSGNEPHGPSYRHHIEQGLMTLPEFWNYTELWNGFGRSRNHAMMGHVKEWLCFYRTWDGKPGLQRSRRKPWNENRDSCGNGSGYLSAIYGFTISYFTQCRRYINEYKIINHHQNCGIRKNVCRFFRNFSSAKPLVFPDPRLNHSP